MGRRGREVRGGARAARATCGAALVLAWAAAAGAAGLPADGLVLFHPYDEEGGTTAGDATGLGHSGALQGGAGLGGGAVDLDGGSDTMVRVADAADLHVGSFTWELWVNSGGSNVYARLACQAERVGGTGPELFVSGGRVAVRINNDGAVFDVPAIGTRTNDGPPDHWGVTADTLPTGTRFHLLLVHDSAARRVRIYGGAEGATLRLSFDAGYTGSFAVSSTGITVGNVVGGGRGFLGRVLQFAVWNRVLSATVDSASRAVTDGEVLAVHAAGASGAVICGPTEACNGLDDDCDGVTDEDATCSDPGATCIGGTCVGGADADADADAGADADPDVEADAPADVGDSVHPPPPCEAVACNTTCRSQGYLNGACRGALCICEAAPAAEGDAGCGCAVPRGSRLGSAAALLLAWLCGRRLRRRPGARAPRSTAPPP